MMATAVYRRRLEPLAPDAKGIAFARMAAILTDPGFQ